MINFVIYEDNKKWQNYYKDIILNIVGCKNYKYKIVILDKYEENIIKTINNLVGNKIFIMDLEVPGKSGIDFAKEIRESGDWKSQIIIITSHEQFKNDGFTKKILMLDFILKKNNIEERIKDALNTAFEIYSFDNQFNFIYNNEYYQIPTQEILYFEKDLNNNYTNIVTQNSSFKTKQSIINIANNLENNKDFFKTHRSCIVNIKNVRKADFSNNLIYFKNHTINLIARDKKKQFKEVLLGENHNDDV